MKKVEHIEAEYKDGKWIPKGVKEDWQIGRNKVIRNGKTVRIDLKLIEYGSKKMFKVTEHT